MELKVLDGEFCICKLSGIDINLADMQYCFFAKTEDEASLVCRKESLPDSAAIIDGQWRGMRIVGQLDFALVGILSKIANILASENVALFTVSTFDTDYFFVKEYNLEKAINALSKNGYAII